MNEVFEFARAAAPFALLLIALLCVVITVIAAIADNKRQAYEDDAALMMFGRWPTEKPSSSSRPSNLRSLLPVAAGRVTLGLVVGAACIEALFFFAPGVAG